MTEVSMLQETAPYKTQALIPAPSTEQTDVDELTWLSLDVQKAQRQIQRVASELAEGIVSLSVALLAIRRRRLYRFDTDPACARSFATFVQQRFGISDRLARQYTDAIAALGEQQYHTLLRDSGVQRTFALALLHQADPGLFEAFQSLPAQERVTISAAQITSVAKQATSESQTDTEQHIVELEQELGRQQGLLQQSRQRLRDLESMHQQSMQSLIDERDDARQDAEQQQQELQRLRELLRQAKASPSVPATPSVSAADVAINQTSVVVVLPLDIEGFLIDLQALCEKLERLAQINSTDLSEEQYQKLASKITMLEQLSADIFDKRRTDYAAS